MHFLLLSVAVIALNIGDSCLKHCGKNLVCHYYNNETIGVCLPEVGLGEICGQALRYPQQCKKGLKCVFLSVMRPGQGGICHPVAKSGQTCGQAIRYPQGEGGKCAPTPSKEGEKCNYSFFPPLRCEQGLVCRYPPKPLLGQSGVCKKP